MSRFAQIGASFTSNLATLSWASSDLTPRLTRAEAAALKIQTAARKRIACRHRRYLETINQLVELMAKQEVRAARLVQRRWRANHQRSDEYAQALLKIQAVTKGYQERTRIKAERQWAAEASQKEHEAECARLRAECTAVIEKQGRRYSLGKWELVLWQERYVTCTDDALCFQVCASFLPRSP